jgi:hypothetical protein
LLPPDPLSARKGISPELGAAERFLARHPDLAGKAVQPEEGKGLTQEQVRVGAVLLTLADKPGALKFGLEYLRKTGHKERLAGLYSRSGMVVPDGTAGVTAWVKGIAALTEVMKDAPRGEERGAAEMVQAFKAMLDGQVEEALEHVELARQWLQHGGLKGTWLAAGTNLNREGLTGEREWRTVGKAVIACR